MDSILSNPVRPSAVKIYRSAATDDGCGGAQLSHCPPHTLAESGTASLDDLRRLLVCVLFSSGIIATNPKFTKNCAWSVAPAIGGRAYLAYPTGKGMVMGGRPALRRSRHQVATHVTMP
jgi:hypothetical protein